MQKRRCILLYPLSLIYGLITEIRNFLFNTGIIKSHELSIPIICVGNITAGGTGKTPHTEYIAGLLRKNFKVALLSRGYKRKTKGFLLAHKGSSVTDIGDEPLQVFRKYPDLTIAVDGNRVRGARKIIQERPETNVILLDDGFQHRRLTPGLSILLSDYNRLMTRDHLLPFGNLRESTHNMSRADIIIITKSPREITPMQKRILTKEIRKAPYQSLYFTVLNYSDPFPVFEEKGKSKLFMTSTEETGIVLVTGIANPGPLLDFLKIKYKEIVHLSFRDHHEYSEKDMDRIYESWKNLRKKSRFVFTTEKDAVRLRELSNIPESLKSSLYYIPVVIDFLYDKKTEFDNMISGYVRKNKRNNRISERKRHHRS